MTSIVYRSLSSLAPIELKYQYYRNEELQGDINTFRDGFSFYEIEGLKNFQDIAINKNSIFILTSAVNLNTIFTTGKKVTLGKHPGTFLLQPRNSTIYFIKYNQETNSFVKGLTSSSTFYVQPIKNSNEVELLVENKYVQVDAEYPYKVFLSEIPLNPDEISRQRFEIVFANNFITIKTKTNSGYRYLAFNKDNILRAVGLVLNDTIVNDYVFKCLSITSNILDRGFTPTNNWVTYYFDVEDSQENKTTTINKNFLSVPTNLLISLPLEFAAEKNSAIVNIANLKTSLTPAGGPAPINNAYDKVVVTSN
jgi:hypothetical protein